ncbi:hypothetical protein [Trinickia dinghuensis]|uniref:Uncharacterized protein n=1 Tax=Trinickia dinghuensis TaxID=2291023 RepID=A0A3D8JYY3_9BURK|nr:hypothetical protein [Trinickia dinghuensis]RDU97834.1 hypothetical protein DWV00_14850 [Trinickia dinghuensis]
MEDQQRKYLDLATCLTAFMMSTLLLAGCGDRSVSGSYVSHFGNQVDLLQITETPDHRFTGTLRHAGLKNDGTLSSNSANVSGSVDGNSITLTVLETPLPIRQNFSGTVTGSGIDLTVGNGAQTGVEHFATGQPSDFDTVVAQLNQAGQPIIAARQRGQRVEQLNRQLNALTDSLNRFVASAHQHLERLPRAQAYYQHAVTVEQAKLDRAQRLEAIGNGVAQGQAGVIVGQMGVDKSQISIADDSFDRAQNDEATAENALNARIAQWHGTCLDGNTVKAGDVIPDMGPCKGLARAVAAYKAVLPPLHNAFAAAAQAKAHGHAQLASIWQTADNLH